MGILDPTQLERLPSEIGNRLDFDALDIIVYKSLGRREINAIANRNWPTVQTAAACLAEVEREGTTLAFLHYCVEARREAEPGFRDVVIAILPGFAAFVLTAKAAMGGAIGELYRLGGAPGEVIEAARSSRAALELLADQVETLDAHKILHDSLHRLLVRRFDTLEDAARSLVAAASKEELRNFQDRMNTSCGTAVSTLTRIRSPTEHGQQSTWVETLKRTATEFQDALDNETAPVVMVALHRIRHILEHEPSQINGIIFATAKALKLNDLIDALRAVSALGGWSELAGAADSLSHVRAVVLGRVVEHQLWQDAEVALWAYDRIFLFPADRMFGDFNLLWPDTRGMLVKLAEQERGASWSQKILKYVGQVDMALAQLELAVTELDGAATGPDVQAKADGLRQAFSNVRADARVRFFLVDDALKNDCAALVAIGAPIKTLLERFANG
jgi:hypothetical protein